MDRPYIESKAHEVHRLIWRARNDLWPLGVPPPKAMLEPDIAAEVLNIEFAYRETLGRFGYKDDHYETAGMLDRGRNIIAVSTAFSHPVRRFTGAHEIGHWMLHPGEVMHRDRPVFDIERGGRAPREREADYFAACYLAPKALVTEAFQARFTLKVPLPLTDAVAFHLCGESGHALMRAGPGSFQFATAVASATSFGGRHFRALADEFGISVSAMAIRVRELGLIEE